ncbi:MAG: ABC transporter permease subunit [Gammaproteobacteria bacterium]
MSDKELSVTESVLPDFNSTKARSHRNMRHIKDVLTRYLMTFGGVGVIVAIVLIAFYLFYVVLPMFKGAEMEAIGSYTVPGGADKKSLHYAMEEQHEIGLRVTQQGEVIFFTAATGDIRDSFQLPIPAGTEITSFSYGDLPQQMLAVGLSNGSVLMFKHTYKVTYPDNERLITPGLFFPFGETPLEVIESGAAVEYLSIQHDGEKATIAAKSNDATIHLLQIVREESFLSDEVELVRKTGEILLDTTELVSLRIDVDQRDLYAADTSGHIHFYDITKVAKPTLVQKVQAVSGNKRITAMEFLAGGISILVGDSTGRIAQWFPVRDESNNYTLQKVRAFTDQTSPIVSIKPEYFRKAFLAIDEAGDIAIYHTTAHRTVFHEQLEHGALEMVTIAPRANAALTKAADGKLHFYHVHNEHPEISWSAIWGKVWYESRAEPEYIWQSSSADSVFEPKFSLAPLAFGTLKAAFYAMLIAMPLAILGAMYTAYFMAPKMRQVVKPTIEIMEALPTVILGFLAGLWLAPFVEKHLPGTFMLLLLVPLSVILAAAAWEFLPEKLKHQVPEGWEAALLVPVVIVSSIIAIQLSVPVENTFFSGNMPLWLSTELGITYDQRNSMVVGFAMGFAVIPTIFSISEDAVYSVPKHLTTGSLALGATSWQTMVRVVLLTASPGIFSAVMIGLGRAVGETMIVVMATGNTAIMDWNIFQGFRALSANIAVEMPESEVGSTHYRILFLAGLVLFIATFCFNTVAEVVRQRLRRKYSSL